MSKIKEIRKKFPFLYLQNKMVAHFTMHTYELNQVFRFVEGIWVHQICFFSSEKTFFISNVRNMFGLSSYISTMGLHR